MSNSGNDVEKTVLTVFLSALGLAIIWQVATAVLSTYSAKEEVAIVEEEDKPKNVKDKKDSEEPVKVVVVKCQKCQKEVLTEALKKDGVCAACKKVVVVEVNPDRDGDTIPNKIEKQYGLNPDSAADANGDLDKDGFTNREEYSDNSDYKSPKYGFGKRTKLDDPKSHPALALHLQVVDIKENLINITLNSVQGDEKMVDSKRMLQFEIGKKTKFLKLGKSFEYENELFKVTDIEYKLIDVSNEKSKTKVKENVSIVTLTTESGQKIKLQLGSKKLPSLNTKVTLNDGLLKKLIKTATGEVITLGNEKFGVEKYVVKSYNSKNSTITIQSVETKKSLTIDSKPRQPYIYPPVKKEEESTEK